MSIDTEKLSYKIFGRFFKEKREKYSELELTLRQIRSGISYDLYLSKILFLSLILGIVGIVLGIVLSVLLGNFLSYLIPIQYGSIIDRNKFLIQTILLATLLWVLFFTFTFIFLYYLPSFYASERRRNIEVTLPHAITFMYALSRGGMNMIEVINSTAKSKEIYGEVSEEFNYTIKQMDFFGKDVTSALRNTSSMTPSEDFSIFLDNLVSILESGGSVEKYLLNRSRNTLEEAREKQKSILDTLEVIAESYVTLLVAGPLFVMIISTIIISVGSTGFTVINVIVYVGIPLTSIIFIVLIDTITVDDLSNEKIFDIDRLKDIKDKNREYSVKQKISDYISEIPKLLRDNPYISMVITFPIAIFIFISVIYFGIVNLSISEFKNKPVLTTTFSILIPFFVITIPISILNEIKMRRRKRAFKELPEILNSIESANNMGVPLSDTFALVSEQNSSVIGEELKIVTNEVEWHGNLTRALENFSNRVKIPEVSRTGKLLSEANRVTGQIGEVIEIAAEDAEAAYKLQKERSRDIFIYVLIIILSFLVFLFVMAVLKFSFLDQISQTQPSEEVSSLFTTVSVENFNMLFFHASIIQAFFGGVLAGVMSEGKVASGLKYSIVLTIITIVVFSSI